MTTQHLWHAAKALLRGKFIAIQSYLRKQEKHQVDTKTTRKRRTKKNAKISRRKEIIKN